VIELKISKNAVANDQAKAREALSQILSQGYAKGFESPILLALAVNEPKREVATWMKRIGLNGDDVWTIPNPPKPAARAAKPRVPAPAKPSAKLSSKTPETPTPPKSRPGPRM
jgi:hypothetical protein